MTFLILGWGDDFKISFLGELLCDAGERNFCFLDLGMPKLMFFYSFPPNFLMTFFCSPRFFCPISC